MKKGFTLAELLAVIVVLAIIMIIAVPQVLNAIETVKQNTYKLDLDLIKKAAETYVESGKKELVGTSAVITLNELVSNGFIVAIKDPKDKSTECNAYVEVEIDGNQATYTPYLRCGDNYETENYNPVLAGEEGASTYSNANIHETSVPSGYTGIYTIEDLNNIRNNMTGNYILMNNLDFNQDSSYTNSANKTTYTTGNGWDPIGNSTTLFEGTLNGNNYVIKNLYINRPSTEYIGLFGIAFNNASVKQLGIESANITGGAHVGSILGSMFGMAETATVSNCYVTGNITGTSEYVGGIVGEGIVSIVDKCYSTANVTGLSYVGGLIGSSQQYGANNSFAVGNVTATATSGAYYGKLLGSGSCLSNCYYSSESTINGNGTLNIIGKDNLSAIFKMQSHTKYALNWDINNVWYANENEYPKLGGTIGEQVVISNNITTIEDLYFINYDLDGTFNLMNDLDFNNSNDYQNILLKDIFTSGTGWDPIGNAVDPNMDLFVGVFNGNGHVIKNLYINRPSSEETIGLFAVTNTGSLVEKLGLESVNIIGHAGVGSFAGQALSATIRDCYATGTIVADGEYVGGIVGVETESTIDRCYNTVNVTGNTYVGGLIGYMFNTTSGNVNNCFSVGNVTATATSGANYGRLIGLTFGTVSNSYYSNTSSITGNGTLCVEGISTTIQNLQALNQTGLNTWNTTTIWQVNSGAYPTLR